MTETLGPALPNDVEHLAHAVLERAARHDVALVTAESCTGGMLASLLTDVEGASHVFERGFVTYSKQAKCDLLGVRRTMIDDCGAVSETVARAMAEGALARSEGTLALAITGFAGSAGGEGETGLIHIACAVRKGALLHRELHLGSVDRGTARIATVRAALELIEEAMTGLLAAK
jgi:nicotinamide-nucleotide amidase